MQARHTACECDIQKPAQWILGNKGLEQEDSAARTHVALPHFHFLPGTPERQPLTQSSVALAIKTKQSFTTFWELDKKKNITIRHVQLTGRSPRGLHKDTPCPLTRKVEGRKVTHHIILVKTFTYSMYITVHYFSARQQ